LQGFLFQVDVAEIVIVEADEPNAVVDFLDTEFLAGEQLMRLRCMQMRPQAVTSTSPSWSGYGISGMPS